MNDSNEDKLQRRSRVFGVAAAALFILVGAWLFLIE